MNIIYIYIIYHRKKTHLEDCEPPLERLLRFPEAVGAVQQGWRLVLYQGTGMGTSTWQLCFIKMMGQENWPPEDSSYYEFLFEYIVLGLRNEKMNIGCIWGISENFPVFW